MTLTLEQKQLISVSFAQIIVMPNKFTHLFYLRLWEIAPDTKELFANTNMEAQQASLMATLASIVNAINGLDNIIPSIRELGERHKGYGVRKEHYDSMGQALVWAFEQKLGENFSAEAKEAWATIYKLIADVATENYE